MTAVLSLLDPPPSSAELPESLPSPFDEGAPHPLARRAAEGLMAQLRGGWIAPGLPASILSGPQGGKMFGVLVVRAPDGPVGYLRAFSGMLAGRWELPGFVPPLFDEGERARLELPGEARVKALLAHAEAFERTPELYRLREAWRTSSEAREAELSELKVRHAERRALRRVARARILQLTGAEPGARAEQRRELDQESRADKAERRRLLEVHEAAIAEARAVLTRLERRRGALDRLRQRVCRELMRTLHDTYRILDASGGRHSLRALFAPGEPPSGAGDCAAPKLLGYAHANGLRPLALAELWWGSPPSTGGRREGTFYPACSRKCGPLLPAMLGGVRLAPRRPFRRPSTSGLSLRLVHEDETLVVVEKPPGLLSVPPRDDPREDSVLGRLRARFPEATGPLLVHRLDLDTSGLLAAALDLESYRCLQRQFAGRTVEKRYEAWLEGSVRGGDGVIDLPLRVDLDDRPRQIHDPVHGKPALTRWRVIARSSELGSTAASERTRVELMPHTGRTHQLRVHAAHPLGLGAPIVGDRLYGRAGGRLMLHATRLVLVHPATGARKVFTSPAPF